MPKNKLNEMYGLGTGKKERKDWDGIQCFTIIVRGWWYRFIVFTDQERIRSGVGSGLYQGQGMVKMQEMKIKKLF